MVISRRGPSAAQPQSATGTQSNTQAQQVDTLQIKRKVTFALCQCCMWHNDASVTGACSALGR